MAEANSKIGFSDNYVRASHNLIGEPEFEVWTSAPNDLDIKIEYNSSGICVTGKDMKDCKIIVCDGFSSETYNGGNQSLILPYPNNDRLFVVSIWKTGYLPIIKMSADFGKIKNINKTFIVREAVLGSQSGVDSSLDIGEGAFLRVRAIDSIDCERNLSVSKNGKLDLQSDLNINLNGSCVLDGGHMDITAKQVNLGAGFNVEKGGELIIY